MAMENPNHDSSKTIKEPTPLHPSRSHSWTPYRATQVKSLPESDHKKKGFMQVGTAAVSRSVKNTQTNTVTLYRSIQLLHYSQDPYTDTEKQLMEGAARRSFPVRKSLWVREMLAYKKSKLIVELPDHTKINMKDSEIKAAIDTLMAKPEVKEILKKFDTLDKNVKTELHVKKRAWQRWIFGRGCTIVFYKGDSLNQITGLQTVNSRRLLEPVLDESNNMSFEGIVVDGQGLDKASCIYGTYQERDITPHTEGYGYSPTEPIMYTAQAHNIILEEDFNEIAKSAWLPSILLKISTISDMTGSNKNTQISNIINAINPGKIVGVSSDDVEGEPIMLDMKPDFAGLVQLADSLEEKIYNNYHIPLFYVKSDKIANVATAKKSLQAFRDGTVADDQEMAETELAEQWYDPLLREELKRNNALQGTANNQVNNPASDVDTPKDAEMPLPFVIRRRFEPPTIDDMLELAQTCQILLNNKQIDLQKANEIMGFPEELTARVEEENEERREEFEANQQIQPNPNQPPKSNIEKPEDE